MKKTIVYLLLATLLLTLTGCGLSKKQGFGELIISGDNITREADEDLGETEPQPLSEAATVTIGDDTKKLGEKFVLRTGTYDAKIKDGTFAGTTKVTFDTVNKTVTLKPTLQLAKLLANAWKFTFDPSKTGTTVENEVHLVGDLPGVTWSPEDTKTYRLIEQADGTWSAIFDVEEGKGVKFLFDTTTWDDTKTVGAGGVGPGDDFKIGAIDRPEIGVKIEPVLAWKFIFDPVKWGATVENEVHLVGDLPSVAWNPEDTKTYALIEQVDGTWSAIFEAEEGKGFKILFDTTTWDDTKTLSKGGIGAGDDMKIGSHPDIVTLEF